MPDSEQSINSDTSIKLSRNAPVALVVGAAGFLGSHLIEKLLKQGVQVIGVDNFSTGTRDNLKEGLGNSNFHLINQSITHLITLKPPRLDYAFFVADNHKPDWTNLYRYGVPAFLRFIQAYPVKVLLVTPISLYEKESRVTEMPLHQAEAFFARFAQEHNLNARVVRLSAVYGPRMHFRENDPLIHLIKLASGHKLQPYTPINIFSTRALFVNDAVNLLIKSVFVGATSHKIYDGAALEPVRLDEAAGILLGLQTGREIQFPTTKLPLWPTPNLEKTARELSWRPRTSLDESLKTTLRYLRDHGELEPRPQIEATVEEEDKSRGKDEEGFAKPGKMSKLGWLMGLVVVILGLVVLPALVIYLWLSWDSNVTGDLGLVKKGELPSVLQSIHWLDLEARTDSTAVDLAGQLGRLPGWGNRIRRLTEILNKRQVEVKGLYHLVAAEQMVGLGEGGQTQRATGLAEAQAALVDFQSSGLSDLEIISLLNSWISLWSLKSTITAGSGRWLVLVTGSGIDRNLIESVGEINLGQGKATANFKPAGEYLNQVASGSGLTVETFREGGDFPSFAQGLIGLVNAGQEQNLAGVLSLSSSGLAGLVDDESGISLDDSPAVLTAGELSRELSGLAVTQKQALLTQAVDSLWQTGVESPANLNNLLTGIYHLLQAGEGSLYVNQPEALSFLIAQGWDGSVGPVSSEEDQVSDFLMVEDKPSEVERIHFSLQTEVGQSGEITDSLSLIYQNQGTTGLDSQPIQLVVPQNSTIEQVFWGGEDVTNAVTQNSQWGRSVLTLPVSLAAGETKGLKLVYLLPTALTFNSNQPPIARYSLKIGPQPEEDDDGTVGWQLKLPDGWRSLSVDPSTNLLTGSSVSSSLRLTAHSTRLIYILQ